MYPRGRHKMNGWLRTFVMPLLPQALASGLRRWHRHRLVERAGHTIVTHSYGGHQLKVVLADPLSRGWYDRDWPMLPELRQLKRSRLRPGARVFNLGAHQAVVALMLAREVGSTGQVIAVEPVPHNAKTAAANRELNAAPQLIILQAAVAERGTIALRHGLQAQIATDLLADHRDQFLAETVTVDGLAEQYGTPDVVFIDVEGAEQLALAGSTAVLAAGADFFVEMHIGCGLETLGGSAALVVAHFPADRYTLLIRAENDETFQPFVHDHVLLRDRCFLLALSATASAPESY